MPVGIFLTGCRETLGSFFHPASAGRFPQACAKPLRRCAPAGSRPFALPQESPSSASFKREPSLDVQRNPNQKKKRGLAKNSLLVSFSRLRNFLNLSSSLLWAMEPNSGETLTAPASLRCFVAKHRPHFHRPMLACGNSEVTKSTRAKPRVSSARARGKRSSLAE
jgi:hypothetical protein